jgi:SAM-dependent methyltransferase
MKNPDAWSPTKFVMTQRGLRASPDSRQVAIGSRLTADLQAAAYERALRDHSRGALLDLGCGQAPLYLVYRDLVTSVTCLDWEHSHHRTNHADVCCDLARGLPFDDKRFDTILATDVLEHIAEPGPLWTEMHRVLRHTGTIIVGVPFLYWIHEEPYDYHRYTRFQLAESCRRAGLDVVSVEPYGGALEVVIDIVAKHAAGIWSALGWTSYRLGRMLSQSGTFGNLSARTTEKFPLGYLLVARRSQALEAEPCASWS